MMKKIKYPKVSIIIPVYNGADYVGEAIESALSQDYPNFEVVVVNDGSKDDGKTEKICKSYGQKIRYFKKPNGGVASALNFGVAKMTGEYFSWLSHDDLYFKDKISKEISAITKNPQKTIVYCNYEEVDQFGKHLAFSKLKDINKKNFLAVLVNNRFLHGCTLLIPGETFTDAGLFDENLRNTQDYDLWFRLIEKGYQFKLCSEALVKSRKHNQQTSISTSDRQRVEDNNLYLKVLDKFKPRQLVVGQNISLGLIKLAISWQFVGLKGVAKKAYILSRQYLKPSDVISWFFQSLKYYLLIILSRPLQKFLDFGARIKRGLKTGKRQSLDSEGLTRVCLIGNIDSSHNLKIANLLAEQGYEVHFITFYPGSANNIKVYYCLRRPFEPKIIWFLRSLVAVRKLVKKIKPSFVQGQYLSSGGVLAYFSGCKSYIIGVLGSDVLEPLPAWLNFLSKKATQSASWVVTSSETLRKATLPFGVNKDKISVVRFGIDLKLFKPAKNIRERKKLRLENEKIIFSPRVIDRIYNIDTIVKAFHLISKRNVKLAIIDKPINHQYYGEVKDIISHYQLEDKVVFLEPIENKEMARYYNLSDVIVSIPNSEGAGVSVLEAMACEKKIISSHLPVLKEWERGKNIFKSKINAKQLARVMLEALEFPQDKFMPIGKLNRRLIKEKANIETCFDELKNIYKKIAE